MPLSPNEVARHQVEKNSPAVQTLIERIDEEMLESFDGSRFIWGDLPSKNAVAIERAVFAAYRAKGWYVERMSDQRDGDFWEFSPAAPG